MNPRKQRADRTAKGDHCSPAQKYASQESQKSPRERRPFEFKLARQECRPQRTKNEGTYKKKSSREQTFRRTRRATTNCVKPLHPLGKQRKMVTEKSRHARQLGCHTQRLGPQQNGGSKKTDNQPSDPRRPAVEENLPESGFGWLSRPLSRVPCSPPSYSPNEKTESCQLKQQRATKTEFARQPDNRFRADERKIEGIPRQETRKKSQNAADQRKKANQRTFAEPVEVRADAGAAYAHSEPKGQPAKDKIPAHRSNVRLRRKVTRKGVHNPCAGDDMIANQPDDQCQENGQHPRVPSFEKVAEIA